jgi:hypothetical protein
MPSDRHEKTAHIAEERVASEEAKRGRPRRYETIGQISGGYLLLLTTY